MPTFTVEFRGLICHVGPDNDPTKPKTHAVLVHEPHDHLPQIQINGSDLVPPGPVQVVRLNKGDKITFSGLTGGSATPDTSFDQKVPRLKFAGLIDVADDLDDSDSQKDVKNHQHAHKHAGVVASVVYAKGDLSAIDPHVPKLAFMLNNKEVHRQCVSHAVLFTATSNGNVTIKIEPLTGPAVSYVVKGNAGISIENDSASGSHFSMYRLLTKNKTCADAKKDASDPCYRSTMSSSEERALGVGLEITTNPECTNSGWP